MFATKENITKLTNRVQRLQSANQRADRMKVVLASLAADINGLRKELASQGDTAVAAAIFEQFAGVVSTGSTIIEQFKAQVAADRQTTVNEALTEGVMVEILTDIVEGHEHDSRSTRHIVDAGGRTTDVRYLTNRRNTAWTRRRGSAWDVVDAVLPSYNAQLTLSNMLGKFFSEDAMVLLRETCPNDYWLAVAARTIMLSHRLGHQDVPYAQFGQPWVVPGQYSREHVETGLDAIRFNAPLKDIAGKPVSEWPEAVRMQLTLENGLMLTDTRYGMPPAVVVNPILQRQLDRIAQEHQQSEQAAAGGDSPRD